MRRPEVFKLVDGYLYKWQEPDYLEIEISDISYKGGDWPSYVAVRTRAPGLSPHLKEGKLNLAAATSRAQFSKLIGNIYQSSVPLDSYMEMACVLAMRAERDGADFLQVGSLPGDSPPLWLVTKVLRMNAPNSIYGDGGVGKSTLAALIGGCVSGGLAMAGFVPEFTGPVLWLDWESDQWDIDDTIKQLRIGHENHFPDFYYRRETWPITQTFKQVAKQVATEGVALVVLDSVGYAMGGDPESADATLRFTQAVRAFNTTVLLIDHVRKGDSGGKAFGSAYKHNEVRTGFEIIRQQVPGESVSHLGMFQRKSNKGGFLAPFGLKVEFGEGFIRYDREEIQEEELVEKLSVPRRVRKVLTEATGLMNADEIAGLAGAPVEQVKARLSEMAARDEVYATDAKGWARRYALKSDRVEVGPR